MFNAIKNRYDLNVSILLFVLTTLSRFPFTSKLLYHIDSVNYSLGLIKYDISVHQPHPPGYFLYVMLGRLVNLFIRDANSVFVFISIVFSGLAVVAIYQLGKEIYGQPIGIIAAILAITSPNLWFHGEIALNYILEAFFSTFIAFLCWQIHKGKDDYVFVLFIVLALAAGIRQNTTIFLMPLVLFCIRHVQFRNLAISLLILVSVMLCWLIPMMSLSGGITAYIGTFKEFWHSNAGNNLVIQKGLPFLAIYSKTVLKFIALGIGGGIALLSFGFYYIIRKGNFYFFTTKQAIFLYLWVLPSLLFYLFIFIHPGNPGYILIILPAFLILTAKATVFLCTELSIYHKLHKYYCCVIACMVLVTINLYIFLGTNCQVSSNEIKGHDQKLSIIIDELRKLDSKTTVLFLAPSIVFGYRHIMYYLPNFMVIDSDSVVRPRSEICKIFWGIGQRAHLSDRVSLSKEFVNFAAVFKKGEKFVEFTSTQKEILPGACLATGPITFIQKTYPNSTQWLNRSSES